MLICDPVGWVALVRRLVGVECFASEAVYVSPVVGGGDDCKWGAQLGGGEAL